MSTAQCSLSTPAAGVDSTTKVEAMSKLVRRSGALVTMGRQVAGEMSLATAAAGDARSLATAAAGDARSLVAACAEEVKALPELVWTLVEVGTGTVLPALGLA
jgi:hypothetical protein